MTERRKDNPFRLIFGGLRQGDPVAPTEQILPPIQPEESEFSTVTQEEFQMALMAYGASLMKDTPSMRARKGQLERTVQDALDHFGIKVEGEAEKLYALHYIVAVRAMVMQEVISKDTTISEKRRTGLIGSFAKATQSFAGLESLLLGNSVNKVQELPKNIQDTRLSADRMIQVRDETERYYATRKLIDENINNYPVDDERSAIPALSDESNERLSSVRQELDEVLGNNLTEEGILTQLKERLHRLQLPSDIKELTDEQHQALIGVENEVRDEIFQKVQIPERVDKILSELGLSLDNPLYIIYALLYIRHMAGIKYVRELARIRKPQDSEKTLEIGQEMRRSLAEVEALFETQTLGLSRNEIMQVRESIEEAFRRNPQALGGEVVVKEEERTPRIPQDEFRQLCSEVKEALKRAREDATTKGFRSASLTRLNEKIEHSLTSRSASPNVIQGEETAKLGSIVIMGRRLHMWRVPEMLTLYKLMTKGKTLPDDLQSFLEVINPDTAPDHLLRSALITRDALRSFKDKFEPNVSGEDSEFRENIGSLVYLLVEALDILRVAKIDFTDRKFLESVRSPGVDRDYLIASNIFGILDTYVHPQTLDALFEATDLPQYIAYLQSS